MLALLPHNAKVRGFECYFRKFKVKQNELSDNLKCCFFPGCQTAIALLLLEWHLSCLPKQDNFLRGLVDQMGGREIKCRRSVGFVDRSGRAEKYIALAKVDFWNWKLFASLYPTNQQVNISPMLLSLLGYFQMQLFTQ